MAPLQHFSPRKLLLVLFLVSVFLASICISTSHGIPSHRNGRRKLLAVAEEDGDEPVVIKKKATSSKPKNQTKLAKPANTATTKNQTKLIIKTSIGISSKNQTKLLVKTPIASSTKNQTKLLIKTPSQSAKNKTKTSVHDQPIITTKTSSLKKQNSTTTKKAADLTKSPPPKTKTAATAPPKSKTLATDKKPKRSWPSWVDQDDDDDLVSEFRTLPSKFQEQLLPDLERISKTSQVYLNRANKEITRGFKPYVGNKYAPTIASFISLAFIIIPLILVSLIFNKIKTYFSLQRIIIFIQIYLSIYFSILCISAIVTGLEPLKFLYATSQSTYFCLQILQTLAYVLYLLLLLMYLVLVFSTETAFPTKLLGLAQTIVGYAVGLHYYVTVFHKTVLHQPPKTSWKIHAIYAASFLLICVLTRADRTKKPYSDEDESKLS